MAAELNEASIKFTFDISDATKNIIQINKSLEDHQNKIIMVNERVADSIKKMQEGNSKLLKKGFEEAKKELDKYHQDTLKACKDSKKAIEKEYKDHYRRLEILQNEYNKNQNTITEKQVQNYKNSFNKLSEIAKNGFENISKKAPKLIPNLDTAQVEKAIAKLENKTADHYRKLNEWALARLGKVGVNQEKELQIKTAYLERFEQIYRDHVNRLNNMRVRQQPLPNAPTAPPVTQTTPIQQPVITPQLNMRGFSDAIPAAINRARKELADRIGTFKFDILGIERQGSINEMRDLGRALTTQNQQLREEINREYRRMSSGNVEAVREGAENLKTIIQRSQNEQLNSTRQLTANLVNEYRSQTARVLQSLQQRQQEEIRRANGNAVVILDIERRYETQRNAIITSAQTQRRQLREQQAAFEINLAQQTSARLAAIERTATQQTTNMQNRGIAGWLQNTPIFSQQLTNLGAAAAGAAPGVGGLLSSLGGISPKALAITATVGGLVTLFTSAAKASVALEADVARVSTLLNEKQEAGLPNAIKSLRQEAVNAGIPLKDLNDAFYNLLSSAPALTNDLGAAASLIGKAAKTAKAMGATTNEVTLAMAKLGNAAKLPLEDLANQEFLLDTLAATMNLGLIPAGSDLANNIAKTAPVMAMLTSNTKDAITAIGAMTAQVTGAGVSVDETQTQIKALAAEILEPAKAMKLMTMGFKGLREEAGQVKVDNWKELITSIGKDLPAALNNVFTSAESKNALRILASNTGKDFEKMFNDIQSSGGIAKEMFDEVAVTGKAGVAKLSTSWNELLLNIGEGSEIGFGRLMTAAANALAVVNDLFKTSTDRVQELKGELTNLEGQQANISGLINIGEGGLGNSEQFLEKLKENIKAIAKDSPLVAIELEKILNQDEALTQEQLDGILIKLKEIQDKKDLQISVNLVAQSDELIGSIEEKLDAAKEKAVDIAGQFSAANAFSASLSGADTSRLEGVASLIEGYQAELLKNEEFIEATKAANFASEEARQERLNRYNAEKTEIETNLINMESVRGEMQATIIEGGQELLNNQIAIAEARGTELNYEQVIQGIKEQLVGLTGEDTAMQQMLIDSLVAQTDELQYQANLKASDAAFIEFITTNTAIQVADQTTLNQLQNDHVLALMDNYGVLEQVLAAKRQDITLSYENGALTVEEYNNQIAILDNAYQKIAAQNTLNAQKQESAELTAWENELNAETNKLLDNSNEKKIAYLKGLKAQNETTLKGLQNEANAKVALLKLEGFGESQVLKLVNAKIQGQAEFNRLKGETPNAQKIEAKAEFAELVNIQSQINKLTAQNAAIDSIIAKAEGEIKSIKGRGTSAARGSGPKKAAQAGEITRAEKAERKEQADQMRESQQKAADFHDRQMKEMENANKEREKAIEKEYDIKKKILEEELKAADKARELAMEKLKNEQDLIDKLRGLLDSITKKVDDIVKSSKNAIQEIFRRFVPMRASERVQRNELQAMITSSEYKAFLDRQLAESGIESGNLEEQRAQLQRNAAESAASLAMANQNLDELRKKLEGLENASKSGKKALDDLNYSLKDAEAADKKAADDYKNKKKGSKESTKTLSDLDDAIAKLTEAVSKGSAVKLTKSYYDPIKETAAAFGVELPALANRITGQLKVKLEELKAVQLQQSTTTIAPVESSALIRSQIESGQVELANIDLQIKALQKKIDLEQTSATNAKKNNDEANDSLKKLNQLLENQAKIQEQLKSGYAFIGEIDLSTQAEAVGKSTGEFLDDMIEIKKFFDQAYGANTQNAISVEFDAAREKFAALSAEMEKSGFSPVMLEKRIDLLKEQLGIETATFEQRKTAIQNELRGLDLTTNAGQAREILLKQELTDLQNRQNSLKDNVKAVEKLSEIYENVAKINKSMDLEGTLGTQLKGFEDFPLFGEKLKNMFGGKLVDMEEVARALQVNEENVKKAYDFFAKSEQEFDALREKGDNRTHKQRMEDAKKEFELQLELRQEFIAIEIERIRAQAALRGQNTEDEKAQIKALEIELLDIKDKLVGMGTIFPTLINSAETQDSLAQFSKALDDIQHQEEMGAISRLEALKKELKLLKEKKLEAMTPEERREHEQKKEKTEKDIADEQMKQEFEKVEKVKKAFETIQQIYDLGEKTFNNVYDIIAEIENKNIGGAIQKTSATLMDIGNAMLQFGTMAGNPYVAMAGAVILGVGIIGNLIGKVFSIFQKHHKDSLDLAKERYEQELRILDVYNAQVDAVQRRLELEQRGSDQARERWEQEKAIFEAALANSEQLAALNERSTWYLINREAALVPSIAADQQQMDKIDYLLSDQATAGERRDYLDSLGIDYGMNTKDDLRRLRQEAEAHKTINEGILLDVQTILEYRKKELEYAKQINQEFSELQQMRIDLLIDLQLDPAFEEEVLRSAQMVSDAYRETLNNAFDGLIGNVENLTDDELKKALLEFASLPDTELSPILIESINNWIAALEAEQEALDAAYQAQLDILDLRSQLRPGDEDYLSELDAAVQSRDLLKEQLEIAESEGMEYEYILELKAQIYEWDQRILELNGQQNDELSEKIRLLTMERQALIERFRQGQGTQADAARIAQIEEEVINTMTENGASQEAINATMASFAAASYDKGSPYIEKDEIAKVHKGERIFTKMENAELLKTLNSAINAPYEKIGQVVANYEKNMFDKSMLMDYFRGQAQGDFNASITVNVESSSDAMEIARAIKMEFVKLHETAHKKVGNWNGR